LISGTIKQFEQLGLTRPTRLFTGARTRPM
jgi:hypothetical protein